MWFLVGDEEKRYSCGTAPRHPSCPTHPTHPASQTNEMLHHKWTLNGYLAQFTGQTMEQITMDTDRDFFMSAQEAVEYGMVDAVISRKAVSFPVS